MRLLILLPALLISLSPLLAQDRDATAMLGAADSATAAVQSAVYDAEMVNMNVDGQTRVTTERIYIRRNPADAAVGMKVRIEMEKGNVITYDGEHHLWLTPGTKKLWRYDPTLAFSPILEGTTIGRLLTMIFKPESPFMSLAPLALLDTPMVVAGVPCRSIRVSWPDDEEQTGRLTSWSFGERDHLPRRYTYASVFRGLPYTDTLTISNLRVGVPLADSLFTMALPAGFVYDTVRPEKPAPLLAAGSKAPDWTLTGLDGGRMSLAKLRGRVVVLDFWYMSCPPCLASMPKLSALQKNYDTSRVMIVGVNIRDSLAHAARFIAAKKFSYGFAFGGDAVARTYNVSAYPTFYVIDRDGTITGSHEGYSEKLEEELGGMIEAALRR